MAELNPKVAQIASMVADQARTNMLSALMAGRALTATELSAVARVTPSTTSGHLAKLVETRLLAVEKQGRHRYYRIASPAIAHMLESIMAVADLVPVSSKDRSSPIDQSMRRARTCYDHIAGRLGVRLADKLTDDRCIEFRGDKGAVTAKGAAVLAEFGIDLNACGETKRIFCRPCLDWSERRSHIAGAVGAQILQRCLDLGWVSRTRESRALKISSKGQRGFFEWFAIKETEI